nr:MAG TPA: hypothetical protein [Caudoviricetes sp.]
MWCSCDPPCVELFNPQADDFGIGDMPGAYIIIERDEFRRVAFPAAFRAGKQAVFIGEAVAFALFKAVGAGEMFPAQGRVVCQPRGKVFFRVALNGAHDAVFRVIAGSKGPLTPAVRAVTHRNTLVLMFVPASQNRQKPGACPGFDDSRHEKRRTFWGPP